MAFHSATNWSVLSRMSGPIQGPLLSYETFTAFTLEASFFGILLFGRSRVPPWLYLFRPPWSALGTTLSAFWIMANNTWMQVPVGYVMENGRFVPNDWSQITLNGVLWVRFPHMVLAAYLTGRVLRCGDRGVVPAARDLSGRGACYAPHGLVLCGGPLAGSARVRALHGDYIHHYQPAKFAAIEGRWHDEQPASEVLIGIPTRRQKPITMRSRSRFSQRYAHAPRLQEVGLTDFRLETGHPLPFPSSRSESWSAAGPSCC